MGGIVNIQARTRYNMWDLLGDVGGFNDGLLLICSLFMAPYAEFAFKTDYLKTSKVDKDTSLESSESDAFT